MKPQAINIVWIKRDIRTQDHEPLHLAASNELPFVIIYIFEPSIIQHADTSLRHLQFQYHSIQAFNAQHQQTGKWINLFYSEANEVFEYLQSVFTIKNIFSYQESGIELTWKRDKRVAQFCKRNHIHWKECQRDGIMRGISNRTHWDKQWYQAICNPIIQNQYANNCLKVEHHYSIETTLKEKLESYPTTFQPAGEQQAWRYLRSFTLERGHFYHKMISKPSESRMSCSRLSPYFAWGNISIRQAYQHVRNHELYPENKFAFEGMLTRLKWHCHFIQKFEMECTYEKLCVNKGYESMLHENNPAHLQAWKDGKTGFPLVDACMRCLQTTGWINFRMRAMVVSVLCHHLDIDWKLGVYHLANLFLDYEPGIHYPQFQMQAGTTGVNTVRMYNPVKQSIDHDPKGLFIKKWVPELQHVPTNHIHEPWKMTAMEQTFIGIHMGIDYPLPVVDLDEAGKKARVKIWGLRKTEQVREENQRIVNKHTRNKPTKLKNTRKKNVASDEHEKK